METTKQIFVSLIMIKIHGSLLFEVVSHFLFRFTELLQQIIGKSCNNACIWPTLPGPGRQPLGGSILLKFLPETRLQSESFDTLDDLLGFRVQKL